MVNNYIKLETRKADPNGVEHQEFLFFDAHDPRQVAGAVDRMVHSRLDGAMRGMQLWASVWKPCPGVPAGLPAIAD